MKEELVYVRPGYLTTLVSRLLIGVEAQGLSQGSQKCPEKFLPHLGNDNLKHVLEMLRISQQSLSDVVHRLSPEQQLLSVFLIYSLHKSLIGFTGSLEQLQQSPEVAALAALLLDLMECPGQVDSDQSYSQDILPVIIYAMSSMIYENGLVFLQHPLIMEAMEGEEGGSSGFGHKSVLDEMHKPALRSKPLQHSVMPLCVSIQPNKEFSVETKDKYGYKMGLQSYFQSLSMPRQASHATLKYSVKSLCVSTKQNNESIVATEDKCEYEVSIRSQNMYSQSLPMPIEKELEDEPIKNERLAITAAFVKGCSEIMSAGDLLKDLQCSSKAIEKGKRILDISRRAQFDKVRKLIGESRDGYKRHTQGDTEVEYDMVVVRDAVELVCMDTDTDNSIHDVSVPFDESTITEFNSECEEDEHQITDSSDEENIETKLCERDQLVGGHFSAEVVQKKSIVITRHKCTEMTHEGYQCVQLSLNIAHSDTFLDVLMLHLSLYFPTYSCSSFHDTKIINVFDMSFFILATQQSFTGSVSQDKKQCNESPPKSFNKKEFKKWLLTVIQNAGYCMLRRVIHSQWHFVFGFSQFSGKRLTKSQKRRAKVILEVAQSKQYAIPEWIIENLRVLRDVMYPPDDKSKVSDPPDSLRGKKPKPLKKDKHKNNGKESEVSQTLAPYHGGDSDYLTATTTATTTTPDTPDENTTAKRFGVPANLTLSNNDPSHNRTKVHPNFPRNVVSQNMQPVPQLRERLLVQEKSRDRSVMSFTNACHPLEIIRSHLTTYSKCCPRHDIQNIVVIGTTCPASDAFGPKRRYSSINDIRDDTRHAPFNASTHLTGTGNSGEHILQQSRQVMSDMPMPASVGRGRVTAPTLVSEPSPTVSLQLAREFEFSSSKEETLNLEQQVKSHTGNDTHTVPENSLRDHKDRMRTSAELLHAQDYPRIFPIAYEGKPPPHTLPPELRIPYIFITGLAYYKLSSHKKSVQYFQQCLQLAEECGRDGDVTICCIYNGDIEFAQRKYGEAAERYQKALRYYSRDSVAKDFCMILPTQSALWSKCGSAFKNASKVDDSISAYEEAIEQANSKKDKLAAHTSLGNLYQGIGVNGRAVKEYEDAIQLATELDDKVSLGWNHGNLGNALLGLYQRDKALHHLFKALDMAVEHETTPQAIGRAYNNLGTAYQAINDYSEAEKHYDLALSQAIYGNDIPGQARVYGNIGNLQMLKKEFDRAVPHYTEVIRLSQDKSTVTTVHHNRGCAYYDWAEKKKMVLHQKNKVMHLSQDKHQQMMCVVGNPTIPPFKYNDDEWNLGKLPHATKEAEWVAHILKCKPILHEQATKSAVMMRLMNAKVIHLATHGSAVAGFLAFAGMAASLNQSVDAKQVLIYPEEIEKFSITPALVVLSSCDSGRGVFKADGIQGMARAFILAGAQAVLTTLWRVPDESACIFMQFFYQYLVDGVRGTEALHKAMLSVRCFSKYSQYIAYDELNFTKAAEWVSHILKCTPILHDLKKQCTESDTGSRMFCYNIIRTSERENRDSSVFKTYVACIPYSSKYTCIESTVIVTNELEEFEQLTAKQENGPDLLNTTNSIKHHNENTCLEKMSITTSPHIQQVGMDKLVIQLDVCQPEHMHFLDFFDRLSSIIAHESICVCLYYTRGRVRGRLLSLNSSRSTLNNFKVPRSDNEYLGDASNHFVYTHTSASEISDTIVRELQLLKISNSRPVKIVMIINSQSNLIAYNLLAHCQNQVSDNFYFQGMLFPLCENILHLPLIFDIHLEKQSACIVGCPVTPPFEYNGNKYTHHSLPGCVEEANSVAHLLKCTPTCGEQATKATVMMGIGNTAIFHLATHAISGESILAFAREPYSLDDSDEFLLCPEEIEKLEVVPALVVLNSCNSGKGLFTAEGIARAFIRAGAQAVITTLDNIPDESACVFMQFFYQYLVDRMKGTEALHKAMLSVRCFSKYSQYIHWSSYQYMGREINICLHQSIELYTRLGHSSVFPQLNVVKQLEKALLSKLSNPTNVQVRTIRVHECIFTCHILSFSSVWSIPV